MDFIELIKGLSPSQRMVAIAVVVGALTNLVKRWPKVPAKFVPVLSAGLAVASTALVYWVMNLTSDGMQEFVFEVLISGAVPVAGHKFLKGPWVALLGQESADKWLGQADSKPPQDLQPGFKVVSAPGMKTLFQKQREAEKAKKSTVVLMVLIAALSGSATGCNGEFGKLTNTALEAVSETNNAIVATLDEVQTRAVQSRKLLMHQVATKAPSLEAGLSALDKIDAAYDPLWVALERAEKLQHALAATIVTARAAIDTGRMPNIDNVMILFSKLQGAQGAISKALSEL